MAAVNYPLSSTTSGTSAATKTTNSSTTTPATSQKAKYSDLVSADVAAAKVGLEGQITDAINNKVRISTPVRSTTQTAPVNRSQSTPVTTT